MANHDAVVDAIVTSFLTSGLATLFAALLGVPLGAYCAWNPSRIKNWLKIGVRALYGLPPVVVGLYVYSLLARQGALEHLELLFSIQAMILAQFFLILPLIWGGSWDAFEKVLSSHNDTISTLGLTPIQRFSIMFGLARSGVGHAMIIGFGRAVAEVGAVIMVGGNIAGKTRVMTTSIVLAVSTGELDDAFFLSHVLMITLLAVLCIASLMKRPMRMKIVPFSGDSPPEITPYSQPIEQHYTVKLGEKTIITSANVEFRSGSILTILGDSGSGKSTLLRAIAGLYGAPQSYGPQQCAYIPQDQVAFTESVGREMQYFCELFHELTSSSAYFATAFNLNVDVNQPTSSLSGGELQRVCLARHLMLRPRLVLLDEPTSNLGFEDRIRVEQELLRMRDGGACIILATHDVHQSQRIANTTLFLDKGRLLSDSDANARIQDWLTLNAFSPAIE